MVNCLKQHHTHNLFNIKPSPMSMRKDTSIVGGSDDDSTETKRLLPVALETNNLTAIQATQKS